MDTAIELRGSPLVEDTCETLIQRFQKSVADFPDELAVVCTHQSCDIYNLCETRLGEDERTNNANYLRLTYRSLDTGVKFFVKGLEALGAAVGSPLFVICPNQVEYVVTTLSAYQIGLVHVPLNPSNLSNVTEVKHMFQTVLDELHPTNAIIVAQNPKVAGDIDHINLQVGLMKVIVEGHLEGWESFKDVLELGRSTKEEHVKTSDHLDSEEFSVFFTSGTTSLPKGCLVKTARMMDVLEGALSISHTGPGKSIAVSLPNNHGFGHICLMLPLLRGACIVLAGPTFSSTAIIEAISQERCTHLPIVPSMAHAILRDESLHQRRIDSLEVLLFAGAPLPRDLLLQCRDVLRAGQVENFYGMTEGVFCCTGPVRELEQIVNDRYVAIGRPVRGSRIRICAPGELCAVQNGTVGEVHFAGDSMIHQYMGLKSNDIYYDDGRFWFKTGDQGFVDPDRRLFLVGRYKDLIIRGGENISPASIEAVMSSHHKLSTLEPQVVAGLDPIAGELPVAIVREGLDYSLIQELQSTVRSKLGAIYVPNTIISLRELGLNDYPRTMAGKVQKYKLKALVRKYCESRAQTPLKTRESRELADAVVEIWARVLGLLPSQIDICSPVLNVADSILLIKARDRIRKKTGRSIPLQQWNSAFTIADQITLLEQASSDEKKGSAEDTENRRLGPPPAEEIVHLRGDPDELEATKAAVERTIAKYKLTWDDVEDIFPATDLIYALSKSRVVNSWNVYASIVSKSASARQMRATLEAVLANHPLLLSFFVNDDSIGPELGLYATIRPQKSIFDQCILDYGTVDTLQDVKALTTDYPFKDSAILPGPLFHALIIFVLETNSAALITNISHVILDGSYLSLFHEDIDRALSQQRLAPHLPFKVWADSYYSLRMSPMARDSVNYHVSHLQSLRKHRDALQRHPVYQLTASSEPGQVDTQLIHFAAPGLLRLRDKFPGLSPPVIMKAAFALLLIHQTKHTHALFLSPEANRSQFPFIPHSYAKITSFEAADVAGPTFSCVLNLIEYRPNETVVEYLLRVQQTQADLTRHACVPWHEVFRLLGSSTVEDMPALTETAFFNWPPGMGASAFGLNPFSSMQVLHISVRRKLGMSVVAGIGGPGGYQIVFHLLGSVSEKSASWVTFAEKLKAIASWLAEEESWGLPVGQFITCL